MMRARGLLGATTRKLVILGLLVVFFLAGLIYFLDQTGATIPGVSNGSSYQIDFVGKTVKNLTQDSDVTIAGVKVGSVTSETPEGQDVRVSLNLSQNVPLHQGATVRVGLKSLIGQSYVDVVDGKGPALPSGSTLTGASVIPPVDIQEVLDTLDPQTRQNLSHAVQSLGAATGGTQDDVSRLMTGLGMIGRQGSTALQAIAAQSDDLKSLARESTDLLNTLDTGRGQIVDVVQDANRLTAATAGQRQAIESTMRGLPGLLDSARTATGQLDSLSHSLAPVAANLRDAAPALNTALLQLPGISSDLHGLLPSLNGALDEAPATLDRVPTFGTDVRTLIPGATLLLRDVNPMLGYLEPYGRDIGAMTASFGAAMDTQVENGVRPIRLAPIFDSASLRGVPLQINGLDPTHWVNPYPQAGQAANPAPFSGPYPRVQREGP
ncbi:MAG TPA: MlaD family protein [Amycolatopsis sp.]|nr:MlaD family protein [Amycolatopsis sp.]